MKNLIPALFILFCISSLQMSAQKYTINFTPNHLTVNENVDSIHIIATIHPAAIKASGIDINFTQSPDGDYRLPGVTTLGFMPGDSVAFIKVKIIDIKTAKNVRTHAFTLYDFMHVFIKGPDSIFTLTIVDNDSTLDAGIKPSASTLQALDINIFPNPTSNDIVNISTPSSLSGKLKIDLFDMEGRSLKTYYSDNQPNQFLSVTLPENAKGLLLMRFESEGNVSYKRVVAE